MAAPSAPLASFPVPELPELTVQGVEAQLQDGYVVVYANLAG
jgi:hypothetical protein